MSENQEFDSIGKLLNDPGRKEAIGWLSEGGDRHFVGEMSHAESVSLVRELYQLGVVEVWATEIMNNAGLASTDSLIAMLPDDPNLREEIFRWNNRRFLYMGIDPDI